MAEEAVSTAQETAAQEVDTNAADNQEGETQDWQAKYEAMRQHSREWEKRAKENAAAADELEQLKQAQLTEQEKATARAEKAESELAALKAEQDRLAAARSVAEKSGVDAELLEFCQSEEEMERFVRVFQAKHPTVHSAPMARASKVLTGSSNAAATQENQFVKTLFNRD